MFCRLVYYRWRLVDDLVGELLPWFVLFLSTLFLSFDLVLFILPRTIATIPIISPSFLTYYTAKAVVYLPAHRLGTPYCTFHTFHNTLFISGHICASAYLAYCDYSNERMVIVISEGG